MGIKIDPEEVVSELRKMLTSVSERFKGSTGESLGKFPDIEDWELVSCELVDQNNSQVIEVRYISGEGGDVTLFSAINENDADAFDEFAPILSSRDFAGWLSIYVQETIQTRDLDLVGRISFR